MPVWTGGASPAAPHSAAPPECSTTRRTGAGRRPRRAFHASSSAVRPGARGARATATSSAFAPAPRNSPAAAKPLPARGDQGRGARPARNPLPSIAMRCPAKCGAGRRATRTVVRILSAASSRTVLSETPPLPPGSAGVSPASCFRALCARAGETPALPGGNVRRQNENRRNRNRGLPDGGRIA